MRRIYLFPVLLGFLAICGTECFALERALVLDLQNDNPPRTSDFKEYMIDIRKQIQATWQRRATVTGGDLVIAFVINSDGSISDIKSNYNMNYKVLSEAKEAIRSCSPLPPPPATKEEFLVIRAVFKPSKIDFSKPGSVPGGLNATGQNKSPSPSSNLLNKYTYDPGSVSPVTTPPTSAQSKNLPVSQKLKNLFRGKPASTYYPQWERDPSYSPDLDTHNRSGLTSPSVANQPFVRSTSQQDVIPLKKPWKTLILNRDRSSLPQNIMGNDGSMITATPNVVGGYNIFSSNGGMTTTSSNVFGGQNVFHPDGTMSTTTPNVFGGQNIFHSGGGMTTTFGNGGMIQPLPMPSLVAPRMPTLSAPRLAPLRMPSIYD